jgi:ubiquinone/menaquinone biosynthesis C-methylase UbiE
MSQKDVFLASEGDAWHLRNSSGARARKLPEGDPLLVELLQLDAPAATAGARVLEIGCGEGVRLQWLANQRNCECHGIEPSAAAVERAQTAGVTAVRGTAERLPFADASFDIVMFGFCLYLADRNDLFRIAAEADRVLRSPGWLLIHDFYSRHPSRREYHHRAGLFSHKMDYRTLFDWHPHYTNYSHRVQHHGTGAYTDEQDEWVGVSVLRKRADP